MSIGGAAIQGEKKGKRGCISRKKGLIIKRGRERIKVGRGRTPRYYSLLLGGKRSLDEGPREGSVLLVFVGRNCRLIAKVAYEGKACIIAKDHGNACRSGMADKGEGRSTVLLRGEKSKRGRSSTYCSKVGLEKATTEEV